MLRATFRSQRRSCGEPAVQRRIPGRDRDRLRSRRSTKPVLCYAWPSIHARSTRG